MTKIRKQKRKKKFRANVNRKRLRNKLEKLPKIECEDIENSWEVKRSIRTNLKDMGLAYDPNEALKIRSTKEGIVRIVKKGKKAVGIEIEDEENLGEDDNQISANNNMQSEKIHVANKLEADAKAPRERMFRLPNNQVHFVTYLMEKYGDDYKAMARDRKNHYQMTWCQIRAKINTFKSIPEQYAEYLLKSGEIVLDDPTPLEETRRKLGEENLKKYNVPKKRKLPKEPTKSMWEVESVENVETEINEEKNSDTDSNNKSIISKTEDSNRLKKLKLFSEDESSDEENEKNNKTRETKRRKSSNGKENCDDKKSESILPKPKQSEDKIDNSNKNLTKSSRKELKKIEKSQSSDSEDEELDGDSEAEGFVNLSDMSEEELSEEDVLDDGEFVTNSEDESD